MIIAARCCKGRASFLSFPSCTWERTCLGSCTSSAAGIVRDATSQTGTFPSATWERGGGERALYKHALNDLPDYPKDWNNSFSWGNADGWYFYDDRGNWRYGYGAVEQRLSEDEASFSLSKMKYKFTAAPSAKRTLTLYEVFVPDDDPATTEVNESAQIAILNKRTFDLTESKNESREYEIDPSTDQRRNGNYTVLVQPVHISASGVGEAGKDITGNADDPGVVAQVNNGDVDNDGIPDYADGYNLNGQDDDDDDHSYGAQFTTLGINLGITDPKKARIKFTYQGSDPAQVSYDANTGIYTLPGGGKIRLWLKNNWDTRDPQPAAAGCDYIAPGVDYSCKDLGLTESSYAWLAVYVECVKPSETPGDIPIKVEVDPNGSLGYVWSDEIRFTAVGTQLMTADAGGNAVPATKVEYSHPSPRIEGTIGCNGVGSVDCSQILGSISINASVSSAVCDYTAGDRGTIKQLDVYVNDEPVPRYSVAASSVQKGTAGTSLLQPFPFSASFQDTRNVVLSPGTNVIRVVARDPVYGIGGYLESSLKVTPAYVGPPVTPSPGLNSVNAPARHANAINGSEASWCDYDFSFDLQFVQASAGGEFHPYFLQFTGPAALLQQIQTNTPATSPCKIIRGPDQKYYAQMHVDAAPAVLIAQPASVRSEVWEEVQSTLGDGVDFAKGFARGMWGGGVSLLDGTWKLVKFGVSEELRFFPLSVPYVMLYDDGYNKEIEFTVDAAKFAKVMAGIAYQLQAQVARDQIDLLTQNQDDIDRVSEPYKQALSYGAEVLSNQLQKLKNEPPEQQGYIAGRVTFEIVSFLLPYAKAGKLAQLSKLEFLENLKLVKYFQKETRAAEALAATEELVSNLKFLHGWELCFAPGTLVSTEAGLKAIEKVQRGEKVWSRDPVSGQQGYKRVTDTHVSHPAQLYRVLYRPLLPAAGATNPLLPVSWSSSEANRTLESEDHTNNLAPPPPPSELVSTGEHPFYAVTKQAFVAAAQLEAGEVLQLADGRQAQVVQGAWVEPSAGAPETLTTYNLEVEDYHTYFVGKEGVWVHNLCSAGVERYASEFETLLKKAGGDFQKATKDVLDLMREEKALVDDDYDAVGEYIGLRQNNLGRKLTRPNPWRPQEAEYVIPDPRLVENAKAFRMVEGLLVAEEMDRNVAVAKVTVDGVEQFLERENIREGLHSEQRLGEDILRLRDQGHTVEVEQLFTERQPCTIASCRELIDTVMGRPKVYYWTRKGLYDKGNAAAVAMQYGVAMPK